MTTEATCPIEPPGLSALFQCFDSASKTRDSLDFGLHGPLTRYAKLRAAHAPGMPGTFFPPPWVSDPDMHHGTCVTHVP